MACATIVPGLGSVTVEPIRKVMFALLGERADAGAAKAALTTATMTTPIRILHLRIASKGTPVTKAIQVGEHVSLRPVSADGTLTGFRGSARR
jgi:hypothetical protein